MIGQTVDAGDHFKKRAAIPLAPCMLPKVSFDKTVFVKFKIRNNFERDIDET
jgi:hypothetical protein